MTKAKCQEWKDRVEKEINLCSASARKVTTELASSAQVAVMTPEGRSLAIQVQHLAEVWERLWQAGARRARLEPKGSPPLPSLTQALRQASEGF